MSLSAWKLEISCKICIFFSSLILSRSGWLFGLLWWSWNNWKGKHIHILDHAIDTEASFSFWSHFGYIWNQIGTDIEDFKCSWLVVKALELSNEEQKKVLHVSDHLTVISFCFFPLFFCYMIKLEQLFMVNRRTMGRQIQQMLLKWRSFITSLISRFELRLYFVRMSYKKKSYNVSIHHDVNGFLWMIYSNFERIGCIHGVWKYELREACNQHWSSFQQSSSSCIEVIFG